MSEAQSWIYIDPAGQQAGPIPADQLQAYITAGHITTQTQIWTDGLTEWITADKLEGLVFQPAAAATPQEQDPQINPGTTTPDTLATEENEGYPIPYIKKINFTLYITCIIAGFIFIALGFVLLVSADTAASEAEAFNKALIPMTVSGIGIIALIVAGVMHLIAIHRVWALLKPGGGSISPGLAIGLIFIPIFGPIWQIIVTCKMPGEWNRITAQYSNTTGAPPFTIAMAICNILIPLIGQILWMREISRGINFMASARLMPGSNPQPSTGGGIVLH